MAKSLTVAWQWGGHWLFQVFQ